MKLAEEIYYLLEFVAAIHSPDKQSYLNKKNAFLEEGLFVVQ